jgi:putative chitinase
MLNKWTTIANVDIAIMITNAKKLAALASSAVVQPAKKRLINNSMRFDDIICEEETQDQQDHVEIIKDFLDFSAARLGLKKLPKITLITNTDHAVRRKSFGGYGSGEIEIMIANRHIMDVMRTLAHELVHYKQDMAGVLTPDSGRDGSEHENEANARAAVIMRLWAKMNPELFDRAAILAEDREYDLEEGLASKLAGAALAAGLTFNPMAAQSKTHQVKPGDTVYSIAKANDVAVDDVVKANKIGRDYAIKVGQQLKIPKVLPTQRAQAKRPAQPQKAKAFAVSPAKTMTGTDHEAVLKTVALQSGITGDELAAFLSQCKHETLDFRRMTEIGGSLDFRKYDPKFAPKRAKLLGNVEPGDGARYKGRGYIQLTGRYNYRIAGEALGLPLEQQPELVEQPQVAAQVAVWFWKKRVQPNVDNFNDVRAVTKPINPGLKGLVDRKQAFADYKDFYKLPKVAYQR